MKKLLTDSVLAPERVIIETQLAAMIELKGAVDLRVSELQAALGKKAQPVPAAGLLPMQPRKRSMSEAARTRIAAAQKRRWAAHRKDQADAAKAATKRAAPRKRAASASAAEPNVDLSSITA